jgi:hypothetical protein
MQIRLPKTARYALVVVLAAVISALGLFVYKLPGGSHPRQALQASDSGEASRPSRFSPPPPPAPSEPRRSQLVETTATTRDWYAQVQQGKDSSNPSTLGEAYAILSDCILVQENLSILNELLAPHKAQDRRAAAKRLIDGCGGFLLNDQSANKGIRREIANKVRASRF